MSVEGLALVDTPDIGLRQESLAHADHIGGFIWLVRSRIGYFPPCRVYGPPGLLEQANGMLNGILWDRVEDRGPCFEIHEWHRDHLKRWRITAGSHTIEPLADQALDDGIVLREPGFVVRATELDHGIPVLAYAYEPRCQINVRKDKLDELGLRAGPWLQDLKRAYLHGQWQQRIQLENGTQGIRDGVTYDILVGKPFKRDDDYLFTLTHTVTDLDERVVVYDSAGKIHYTPATGTAPGINGTHLGEYSLDGVAPEEVRFVELQVREFEWRTFKNIAVNPEATIPPSDDVEEAPATQDPSTPEESRYTATFSPDLQARIAGVGQPDEYTVSSVWAPGGAPLSAVPEGYATKMGGSSSDKSGVKRRFFIEVSPVPEENDLGIKFKVEGNSVAHNVRKSRDKAFISAEIYNLPDTLYMTSFELGIAFGPWESLHGNMGPHSSSEDSDSSAAFSNFFEKEGKPHVVVTHTPRDDNFRLVVFDGDDMPYASRQVSSFGVGGMHQTEFVVEGDIRVEQLVYMDFQARPYEWKRFANIAIHPDDSDATASAGNPPVPTPPVETVASRPVDKIPFSPAYETALASDTDGRVQIGGGDFGVSRVRRVDAANALKALQFPVFPDDTLHSARFPELAEGEWDCLLIDVDDNGSLGNKLMKCFDVVQFRVFDHRTRKLLWDSDWRYNEYPDKDKFSGGFLSGADGRVFVAKRDERWPDDIDVWFRVDLLNNGKYTHQMMSIEPNYASIAGGDTGRVRIDEIRAGSWNRSYSESGGKVTWIEQNPGSEASECSVVLRRTGTWTDGRINVRALDATGNEYWPQSIHFLDFERSALEVVTFPLAADRVHQLKFARLEDQVDFRRTFYFDGVTLPPAAAPPVENIEEAAEETASFPPPTVTLSAHAFQQTGEPVILRLDSSMKKLDSFISKITIRCDGEELPWFSTEESGVKMMIGANFSVSPRHPLKGLSAGKHRVSVLLHDVKVRPRSGVDTEAAAVYPTLETNEVEFEVVPEIPADYFEPTMEDGWKSMLDKAFADLRVQDPDDKPVVLYLDWRNVESIERPFALAFDVAMEEQTSGTTHPVGRMTADAWPNNFSPRQHISLTMDNDDARELLRKWSGKQVRLVLTPSSEAALEDPAIRSYYGEVHTTEWVVLKPELTWNVDRILAPYGVDHVMRYGTSDVPYFVDGASRYGISDRTILIEDWGVTCKAILDGGAVVRDPESDTRFMPLKDIVLPGAALDYIEQHLQELDESEVREIAIAPDALNYIGVRAPSGEVGILLVDTNRFGEREIYRWQVPPSPSAQVRPGWLRLEFRAHELLARSGDYRTVLVRNNTRLLRVESDLTGVDQPEGNELLQIVISGGPGRPARYGHVTTPNLGTRRELERTNGLTPGSDQITKEYILRRSWDGAHVGVPALVTPNRMMRVSDVWRTWRSANDSRTIEYTDDHGWRFVAHGAGWSPRAPEEMRYPLLSLFECYRPNGTLYSRTELTEGRPDTTHFFAMNGITLDGQTRLTWDEQDGTASLADFTWRVENDHYRRYIGSPNGVIHEEEVLALVDGEFIVQERLHHAPDSKIQVFELDMDAIVGPLADFRQETRDPDLAVTTDTRGRTRSTSFVPRDPAASYREGRDGIPGSPRS